jgi:XisH protein
MPAHDVFHAAVKQGLIKEGWTITDDPLVIEFGTLLSTIPSRRLLSNG